MSRIAEKRQTAAGGDKGSMPNSPTSNRSLAGLSTKGSQRALPSAGGTNPLDRVSSQDKIIADAVNPMIVKNKLWNKMTEAVAFNVKK